jgi:bacillithiol biosynthesis cysteine-adding enzyme BshC
MSAQVAGRSFISAFLDGDRAALALLPDTFRHQAARIAHAKSVARPIAPELAAILRAQEESLPPSRQRRENIDALAKGACAAITGQQMGLFLGPLFTYYKAATAIAAARAIEAESGTRCVPIFWLQTEDHDFPEIDHCHVPLAGAPPVKLVIDGEPRAEGEGGRIAIAHRTIPPTIESVFEKLEVALDGLPHAAETIALFRAHYRPGVTLARAFAGVLATLFADEGLVIFDPRDPAVARLLSPMVRAAIDGCDAIGDLLLERSAALSAAGFSDQVHVRGRSPLCFIHPDGARGPRFRVERETGDSARWSIVGRETSLSSRELAALVENDPLCCSTSALLRPIAQDTLFPTAAYVGGPGEVSYFAQVAPLHARFGLPPPLIVPRARFRVTDGAIRSLLEKMGLIAAAVERPRDDLLRESLAHALPAEHLGPDAVKQDLSAPIEARLAELDRLFPSVDANLTSAVRRTRETVQRAIDRLTERYRRALLERHRTVAERLDRLIHFLNPEHTPQERYHALPHFLARAGAAEWKARVFAALDPFAATVGEIAL